MCLGLPSGRPGRDRRFLSRQWIQLLNTEKPVPVISRFYGIAVYMNYRDHEPPHFHARHQDQEVLVEIESGLVTGSFSRRALRLLFEWMEIHKEELERNWDRARNKRPLKPIEPLT